MCSAPRNSCAIRRLEPHNPCICHPELLWPPLARQHQIALLPLDILKIKAQTNPDSLAGRSVVDIFVKEGRGLYRGAGWTAARNAPGSFALFGGASVVKDNVFNLECPRDATLFQDLCASIAGAISRYNTAAKRRKGRRHKGRVGGG